MRNPRNFYEESPDRLRDLYRFGETVKGERPKERSSRSALLREHERHLKLLLEGAVPGRTCILPLPYPPSHINPRCVSARKLVLNDLRLSSRDAEAFIVLRTLSAPYIYSATICIVEDETGDVARLTCCNLEDSPNDPIIPKDCVLAVKQPSWSEIVDGDVHIRVDHPGDLVILEAEDDLLPISWRASNKTAQARGAGDWQKEGDVLFLKKKFRKALDSYTKGLALVDRKVNPVSAIALLRKGCNVLIILSRLDHAAYSLAEAISLSSYTCNFPPDPVFSVAQVQNWLHNGKTADPLGIAENIPRPLKELAARVKFDLGIYQDHGNYDFPKLLKYTGPLMLHLDCASYICDTEVKQTGAHGRGLFAKRSFKMGELIAAEKAFALPGYLMQDPSSDCLLYSLGNETAAPRPGALLFRDLVQKLRWNSSLRKAFFDNDDGGYWERMAGEQAQEREDVETLVDVFRTEIIRQRNCFSCPQSSVSQILSPSSHQNPELRNGFWLHASYVNHSCLPNSIRTFIGDMHFLRASRDIAVGEEITNQYVAPEVDIDERQAKYRGTWGFECDCRLCASDGSISKSVRLERMRVFEELKEAVMKIGASGSPTITGIKKVARMTRALEALYERDGMAEQYDQLPRLGLVHPTLFITEAWRSVGNEEKTIEYATKLLRNFGILVKNGSARLEIDTRNGLVNVEALRALKYLAEAYKKKAELELSEQYMRVAKTWYVIVTGCEVGREEWLGR